MIEYTAQHHRVWVVTEDTAANGNAVNIMEHERLIRFQYADFHVGRIDPCMALIDNIPGDRKCLRHFCPVNILVQEQIITIHISLKMRHGILYEMYKMVSLPFTLMAVEKVSNEGMDDIATSQHVSRENYVSKLHTKGSRILKRSLL